MAGWRKGPPTEDDDLERWFGVTIQRWCSQTRRHRYDGAPGLIHAVVRGAALPRPIREDRAGYPDEGEQRWEYISVLTSR